MRGPRLRLAIAVVALALGAAAAEGAAAANSDVPAVELHLDALAAGTTPDSSGNDLSATAQGTLIPDGRFGQALRMNAAGDAVNVANHPLLAPAQVTVMAWVRQSGWGFDQFLVGKPYPALGCNTDSYALTSGLTGGVRFIVDVGGSSPKQYSSPESSTGSVWDGQWHAIAGTYDGSTVRLYQDGQPVGSTPTDGSPIIYDTNPNNAGLAGLYSGIPSNPNNCTLDQKYSGDIDEIRVYDHALSAQEIAKLQDPSATTPPRLAEPPTVPPTLPGGGEPVGGLPGGVLGVDTRILSGPTEVISGAPTFTFDSTVAGATFQCWIDTGAPAPCTSPYTRFGLTAGKHTFFVKASAGGRGDLTPASWPFTIGTTVRKGTCVDVVIKFPGPIETCTPVKVTCPPGATCTVRGVAVELRDKDVKFRSELIVSGTVGAGGNAGVTCNNHPDVTPSFDPSGVYRFEPCPKEFTLTRIGDGGAARVNCQWGDFTDIPVEYRLGPEADRVYTCTGEVTTTPARALVVVGTGTTKPATVVTAPGKLTLTGRATGTSALAAAARKPAAPFRSLRVTAKAAGPVQLPFKLTAAAKRILKKKGRLSVAMTASFKPAGAAKATVRRQRFTFTAAPKRITPKRRPRVRRAASPVARRSF